MARAAPVRQVVERLWAEGKTAREIAAVVGWTIAKPNVMIACARARGYNLPHRRTPEQLARITEASIENLRRARAAQVAA